MASGGSGPTLFLPLSILEGRSLLFHLPGESPKMKGCRKHPLSAPDHAGGERIKGGDGKGIGSPKDQSCQGQG